MTKTIPDTTRPRRHSIDIPLGPHQILQLCINKKCKSDEKTPRRHSLANCFSLQLGKYEFRFDKLKKVKSEDTVIGDVVIPDPTILFGTPKEKEETKKEKNMEQKLKKSSILARRNSANLTINLTDMKKLSLNEITASTPKEEHLLKKTNLFENLYSPILRTVDDQQDEVYKIGLQDDFDDTSSLVDRPELVNSEPTIKTTKIFNPRPSTGLQGRPIELLSNFFQINIPNKTIYHYKAVITPDKCPRKVFRQVIDKFIETDACLDPDLSIFKNGRILQVFDGKSNLYTTCDLGIGRFSEIVREVELTNKFGTGVFKIILKESDQKFVNLGDLNEADRIDHTSSAGQISGTGTFGTFSTKTTHTNKIPALKAIDIIMRNQPSKNYTAIGRSFFSQPTNFLKELGAGREVWYGFHQSIKNIEKRVVLNFDVSATAFYMNLDVLEFMNEIIDFGGSDWRERLRGILGVGDYFIRKNFLKI